MALVAPSILSADFGHLHDEIRDVIDKGADWIHVDVMDGRFVPNLTMGPPIVKFAKKACGDVPMDVHLMIVEPTKYIQAFRDAGADYITVHAEACTHLHRAVQQIRATGAKAGIALNPHTHESVLDYVLGEVDLVLIMTVNPGFGGQSLIDSVLHKVSVVREKIERNRYDAVVEVDGGVKVDNAQRFVEAGAQVLVSGSGVFKAADRAAAIAALRRA